MFKGLYDNLVTALTTTWPQYLDKNGDQGSLFKEEFTHSMYTIAGLLVIVLSFLSGLFYYYYLNGRFGNYYRLRHYFWTMLISALFIGLSTWLAGFLLYHKFYCPTSSHTAMLGLINFGYGIVFFIIFSLVLKWGSVMGKRTPF